MRRRWRIGLPRRVRTLVTRKARRGLSANEIACALISMMARSTCSNQRPNTLTQHRISQRRPKASCTARPDHTFGSNSDLGRGRAKSALPCTADIARGPALVRWGPKADMLPNDEEQRFVDRPSLPLIDDLVRRHKSACGTI